MSDASRFLDPGTTEWDLLGEVLVTCPTCGGVARVQPSRTEASSPPIRGGFEDRRLTCGECGCFDDWPKEPGDRGIQWWRDGRDPYFGRPLYLRVGCAGHELWAYNGEHLDLIEAFVSAEHRLRNRGGVGSQTIVQNLPRWIKLASNKAAVLKACQHLRVMLDLS